MIGAYTLTNSEGLALDEIAKQRKIQYFLVSFVDLCGVLRSKLVPCSAIRQMQEEGAGFAGFATWLDISPAQPDLFGVPDPESLIQIPWLPEVGWLASDLYIEGKPLEASPRIALKRQLQRAETMGLRMKTGIECEFFIISSNGLSLADTADRSVKPCYEQLTLMRQFQVMRRICDAMLELGWEPYQNDHEDANGQFEMNWKYDDALKTADRHVFFKYMVKALCEEEGLRATFMPKPFSDLTGNGCHAHVSIWNCEGNNNLFLDSSDELGLSTLAYHFLGGIMHSTEDMCAILNPTVNSYKRTYAAQPRSGATWSPNTVTYSGNNRSHMIRVPEPGQFELRLMDGSTNPYLLQAVILAAGLDGIENKRNPGKPVYLNMYEEGQQIEAVKRLPATLQDALRLLKNTTVLRKAMGDEFIDSYIKLKMQEWQNYCGHLTEWERIHTLDI